MGGGKDVVDARAEDIKRENGSRSETRGRNRN